MVQISKEKVLIGLTGASVATTIGITAVRLNDYPPQENPNPQATVRTSEASPSPLRPMTPTEIRTVFTPIPKIPPSPSAAIEAAKSAEIMVSSGKFSSSPDSRAEFTDIASSSPLSVTEILGGYGDYVKVKAKGTDGKIVTSYVLSESIEGWDKLPKLSVDEVDWFTIKDLTENGIQQSFENPTQGWSQKTIARDLALPSTFRFVMEMAVSGQQAGIAFFGDLKHGGDNWYSGIKQFILLMNSNSSMVMINLRDGTSENPISKPIGVALDGIVYAKFEGRKLTILNQGKEMAVFPDVSQLGQFPAGFFPDGKAKETQLIAGPASGVKVKRLTVDIPSDGKYQEPATPTPIPPTAEPKPTQPAAPTKQAPPPATATPKQPDNTPVPPAPTATPEIRSLRGPDIGDLEKYGFVVHNMDISRYQVVVNDVGWKDENGNYCPGAANSPGSPGICSNPKAQYGLSSLNFQYLVDMVAKYSNGNKLEISFYSTPDKYPYLSQTRIGAYIYYGKQNGNLYQVYIGLPTGFDYSQNNPNQQITYAINSRAIADFLNGGQSNQEILSIPYPAKLVLK